MEAKKHQPGLILLAVLFLAVSCSYSPWETESHGCRDPLSKNLANLNEEGSLEGDIKVAIVTDSHVHNQKLEGIARKIDARGDISFVVVVGDITDAGLLMEYDGACMALRELRVPRFYAIGNHDAISFGKEIFEEMFGPFNYTIRYGGSKFIFFNNNKFEFPEVPDYPWIAGQARLEPGEVRDYTIGFSHIPTGVDVYDEQEVRIEEEFFFTNRFDLAVHGHWHNSNFWRDDFGTPHLIAPWVVDGGYTVLTLSTDFRITLEICYSDCVIISSWQAEQPSR